MSLDRKFLEAQMLYEKIIADLEAKLAESEENNKLLEMQLQDMERSKLAWENKYFKLEQQLAEKENDDLKRIGEKSHLNDLLEDKRKENGILIKAIEQAYQDKISFAVEQLEKVRKILNKSDESGYIIQFRSMNDRLNFYKEFDNQIKQLKEMK